MIDEADRILEANFEEDMQQILKLLPKEVVTKAVVLPAKSCENNNFVKFLSKLIVNFKI